MLSEKLRRSKTHERRAADNGNALSIKPRFSIDSTKQVCRNMARTSRGSAAAAPAMDAGALDDLDLDDMFAEDGDTLFEGLDIQLEGMGDIISDEQKEQKEQKSTASPKRSSGTKTKKSTPVVQEAAAATEIPKRRKTKRKTKAPTAYGDEDEDYTEETQPKKKQRKAAANRKTPGAPVPAPAQTKKKKTKKSDTSQAEKISSPSSKTKKGTGTLPVPLSRGSSTVVAAAGQFGGRTKRGSASLPTNKSKRKLKGLSPSAGQSSATTSQSAQTPTPEAPPPPPPIKPPQRESTYGGLVPSKTNFYPFMEAVPVEPSMKNRKAYPLLDRISSNFTSHLNEKELPTEPVKDVTADSPIYKLLVETYEGANEKERASFTPERRAALFHAIPKLRETIDKMERQKLVHDLFAMCGLLARQHNFLTQNLVNMKEWCKAEFTPENFNETYASAVPKDLLTQPKPKKWPTACIKVKIVCSSYKEPKGTQPLAATLPANVVVAPPPTKPPPKVSTPSAAPAPAPAPPTTQTTTKRKKKEKTTEKPKAAPAPAAKPEAPTIKAYSECTPVDRRRRITDTISQIALQLEENEMKTQHTQKPRESLPDEEPPLHTARMWQWLDSAGFYNSLPTNGLDMQSPEIHPRGLFLTNPTKIQGHDDRADEISSNSLFDRLQSLLVEVDEDDQFDSDDSKDGRGESSDEESLGFQIDDDEEEEEGIHGFAGVENEEMADLSNLSIEERAFVFLRSVGLIQDSVFPMVELVRSSNEEEKKVRAEDDLVNVIGKMSNDLSDLTSLNNGRFAFLESALSKSDNNSNNQTEEERASIIARCQNLLKRSKEKAKKVKQKKDDNLNLPW